MRFETNSSDRSFRLVFLLAIALGLLCWRPSDAKQYPAGPEPSPELKKLALNIKKNSPSLLPSKVDFLVQATPWLEELENQAPDDVKREIAILQNSSSIPRSEAAERLAAMGAYARGAGKALVLCLSDNLLIRPGDVYRLFGAKDFTASDRSVKALTTMGEWALPALMVSLIEQQPDIKDDTTKQFKRSAAKYALKVITGHDLGDDPQNWVSWFMRTYANGG